MMYSSMQEVINELDRNKMLLRITREVDPELEMAEIHRQIYDRQGPAIFFEKIKGSPFPALSNLYGTIERTEYLFRNTLKKVKKVIEIKADPSRIFKDPLRYINAPITALTALPMKTFGTVPSMYAQTSIDKLPLIKSWPMDGGAFITLPQVFTLPPNCTDMMQSNLGMYRFQLSGNKYKLNEEIGLHYQIHRGIGIHHEMYNRSELPFKVSIFIGGLPAHAFAAIMPMPEGISELTFAGMLAGRRFRYHIDDMGHVISSDADFVITGTIDKTRKLPEGPFGDHLGYYSLTHDFPVMKVDRVYHRKNPIWHFTTVGRPPQEDSGFGHLIHVLVKDLTSKEFPGLKDIHAVDAAGVHPLLLAIGKERYMPFRHAGPEEILTIANHILGSGQTSLAKYLFIAAEEDDLKLNTHDLNLYFRHFLERINLSRDLHFQTKTTIDTLDYSGESWNGGSKLVLACRGEKIRNLSESLPLNMTNSGLIIDIKVVLPGILGMSIAAFSSYQNAAVEINKLTAFLEPFDLSGFPLIVICDDASFTAASINNFVWVTFTRSNPSHDIYGINSFVAYKHWGCKGSLIIDARKKPHHAPELVSDESVKSEVKNGSKKN
ncbi:MAG: UbiD family decarboxylase [Saprospiraceae bacterium]|nr:UbiD family decarboxylase [Saprospiraceae bacterium]